jgi:RIO kinase 1
MNLTTVENVFEELSPNIPDLEFVSNLKSGKEADVFLVKDRTKLMALKIYRQNIKFSTRLEYMNTNTLKARTKRAVEHKTKVGREITQGIWTYQEFDAMQRLYNDGAYVPKPYYKTDNAILMGFIGNEEGPAPRLSDIELDRNHAKHIFDGILFNFNIMMKNSLVHGDLSQYNILIDNDEPYIIDFPQILDIRNNANAVNKLRKDLQNISEFFINYLEHREVDELWRVAGMN